MLPKFRARASRAFELFALGLRTKDKAPNPWCPWWFNFLLFFFASLRGIIFTGSPVESGTDFWRRGCTRMGPASAQQHKSAASRARDDIAFCIGDDWRCVHAVAASGDRQKNAKPRTTHRSRGSLITSELPSRAGLSLRGSPRYGMSNCVLMRSSVS